MSFAKIRIFYYGDGINSNQHSVITRQGVEKKATLNLPKKVIAYGDKYGYDTMEVMGNLDHLILKGDGKVLMDVDVNGASNEYIKTIIRYEWLDEYGDVVTKKTETASSHVEEDSEFDDYEWCENVDYEGIEYSTYEGKASATLIIGESITNIVIPEEIVDEDGNKYIVNEFDISSGMESVKNILLPATMELVYGTAFDREENKELKVTIVQNDVLTFEKGVFYTTAREDGAKTLTNTKLANIGEEFTIEEGVEVIDCDAFESCVGLRVLNLPKSIKKIYPAFSGCDDLKVVNIAAEASNVELVNEDRNEEEVNVFNTTIEVNYGLAKSQKFAPNTNRGILEDCKGDFVEADKEDKKDLASVRSKTKNIFGALKLEMRKQFGAIPTTQSNIRFYRSPNDKIIAGVCAGLARGMGIPAFVIRLSCFFFWYFMLFVYLILWIVMPKINK